MNKKILLIFLTLFTFYQTHSQTEGEGNIMGGLCYFDNGNCDNTQQEGFFIVPHDGVVEFGGDIHHENICGDPLPDFFLKLEIPYRHNSNDLLFNLANLNSTTHHGFEHITRAVKAGTRINMTFTLKPNIGGGCQRVNFSINWKVHKMKYADDNEPNAHSIATPILENTLYEGHGQFLIPGAEVDHFGNDWYKLIAPRNGKLIVSVKSDKTIRTDSYYSTLLNIARTGENGYYKNGFQTTSANNTDDGTFESITYCIQKDDILFLNFIGTNNSYQFSWVIEEPTEFIDVEPNNDSVNAINIDIGETKTGNVNYGTDTSISPKDSKDWYKFTTTANGEIKINLNSTNPLNSLSGRVFREDNNNLKAVYTVGNQTTGYTISCSIAGTYYLYLERENYDSLNLGYDSWGACDVCCTTYDIELLLKEAGFKPDAEPNDTYANAIPITEDVNHEGQLDYIDNDWYDYYKLTPTKNGILTINFSHSIPTNNFISLYYKSGYSYKYLSPDSYTSDGNGKITYSCIGAGQEYFIKLTQDSCLSYQFNYNIDTNQNYNETEPNDSKNTAQVFNANEIIHGQLSYGQVYPYQNSNDYFKIPVTFNAPLNINLSVANEISLFLYESGKSNPVKIFKQTSSTGPIATFTHNNIDASKEYYLNIEEFNGFCSDYILSSWSQGFAFSNDSEPNNSIIDAIDIDLLKLYSGQLNFSITPQDEEDFYKFVLNESDDVEFILNASEGLVNTAVLTVYDSNNNQIYQLSHNGVNTSSKPSKTFTKNTLNLTAGSYFVAITGSDQTGSYEFKITPKITLSTKDNNLSNLVKIHPNPANDKIFITSEEILNNTKYAIYDLTGKLIKSKIDLNNTKEINISNLESGIYFIQIKTIDKVVNKRFVKK